MCGGDNDQVDMTTIEDYLAPVPLRFDEPVVTRTHVEVGGGRKKPPPLVRQSTFVLDDDNDNNSADLLSSTQHAGGIKAILEKANSEFVFPDEVKAYISSHFRMIREENDNLREALKDKSKQLDRLAKEHQHCRVNANDLERVEKKLKSTSDLLEKEKAKSKNMAKRIKEMGESGEADVQWFGIKPPPSGPSPNRDVNSPPDEQGYFSRPPSSLQTIDLEDSASDKKHADKKVKALKGQVQAQKEEIEQLKEILHRELGSQSAVKEAMNSKDSSWRGREEQIRRLEDSLASMRALLLAKDGETLSASGNKHDDLRCKIAEVRF